MSWNGFVDSVSLWLSVSGAKILQAVIVFIIGYFVIKFVNKSLSRFLSKSKVDKTVRRFLLTTTKVLLYVVLLLIIASVSGFSITGIVTLFSAVGLALSLAMQSSLSNFANGVVLLVTKPFKSGDLISVNSTYSGVVSEIGFLHTIIINSENKEVKVPNKLVTESVIVNSSALLQRKLDYQFLVSYKSNVEQVKDIILNAFTENAFVLNEPAPFVAISALEQNGIRFIAYCYTDTKNYIAAYYPLLEKIFNEFKKQGIELPYAQMQVHLNNEKEKLPVSDFEGKHKKDNNKKDVNRFGKWLGKGKDEVPEKPAKENLHKENFSQPEKVKSNQPENELQEELQNLEETKQNEKHKQDNNQNPKQDFVKGQGLQEEQNEEDDVTIEEYEDYEEELEAEEYKDYLDYIDEVEVIVQEDDEQGESVAEKGSKENIGNNAKNISQASPVAKKQTGNNKHLNNEKQSNNVNSSNNIKNNSKNNNKNKFPFFKSKGNKHKKHTVIIKKD